MDKPTIVLTFQYDRLERLKNGHSLDTKSAIERARRLETAHNLFVVMRVCPPVVVSYLDANFEPRRGRKDF